MPILYPLMIAENSPIKLANKYFYVKRTRWLKIVRRRNLEERQRPAVDVQWLRLRPIVERIAERLWGGAAVIITKACAYISVAWSQAGYVGVSKRGGDTMTAICSGNEAGG